MILRNGTVKRVPAFFLDAYCRVAVNSPRNTVSCKQKENKPKVQSERLSVFPGIFPLKPGEPCPAPCAPGPLRAPFTSWGNKCSRAATAPSSSRVPAATLAGEMLLGSSRDFSSFLVFWAAAPFTALFSWGQGGEGVGRGMGCNSELTSATLVSHFLLCKFRRAGSIFPFSFFFFKKKKDSQSVNKRNFSCSS